MKLSDSEKAVNKVMLGEQVYYQGTPLTLVAIKGSTFELRGIRWHGGIETIIVEVVHIHLEKKRVRGVASSSIRLPFTWKTNMCNDKALEQYNLDDVTLVIRGEVVLSIN